MKDDLRDRLAAAEDEFRRRFEPLAPIDLMLCTRFGFDFLEHLKLPAECLEKIPADRVGGLQRTPGPGHGQLELWQIGDRLVLAHEWETVPGEPVHPAEEAFLIWLAARLKIANVLHVSAGQGLADEVEAPSLQVLGDHIAWTPSDPLVGWSSAREGARFPQLDDPYDAHLRQTAAAHLGLPADGRIALIRPGPSGPTRAELNAYTRLGAELLSEAGGNEAIAARHCRRRFAALVLILDHRNEPGFPDPGVLASRAEHTLPLVAETLEVLLQALEPMD